MTPLLKLNDDWFAYFVSNWLSVRCIGIIDVAITRRNERVLWRKCLSAIGEKVFSKHKFCDSSIRWLIQRRISVISLSTASRRDEKTPITCDVFRGIHISSLRSIKIEYCAGVNDECLSNIAQGCRGLTSIDLIGSMSFTEVGIAAIAEGCKELTSITFGDIICINDRGLIFLAKGCPYIKHADVNFCNFVTDAGIMALSRCKELETINIQFCDHVSDPSIIAIASGCPKLRTFSLRNSDASDDALLAIAVGCPHLRVLTLHDCNSVTDAGIAVIEKECPHLVALNICYCFGVTHHLTDSLMKSNPSLSITHESFRIYS